MSWALPSGSLVMAQFLVFALFWARCCGSEPHAFLPSGKRLCKNLDVGNYSVSSVSWEPYLSWGESGGLALAAWGVGGEVGEAVCLVNPSCATLERWF